MDLKTIFEKKHELWLKLMYGSFYLKNSNLKFLFDSFSNVEFRHLKWLGKEALKDVKEFDYLNNKVDVIPKMIDFEREEISLDINDDNYIKFLNEIKSDVNFLISSYENKTPLFQRIKSDESYYLYKLENLISNLANQKLNYFNTDMPKKIIDLNPIEDEILTNCLKSQVDKEYKSVISFLYIIIHITNRDVLEIFTDLMEESLEHLKHYINMMTKIGILETPKVVAKSEYQISDIKTFIEDSILDEQNEQDELYKIAETISSKEFKKLVEFVNEEEKYHIELLREAFNLYKG